MGYLVDFEKAIEDRNAPSILRLWEEYTSTDEVEEEDFRAILEAVKASELSEYIGRHIERGLHLWDLMQPGPRKDEVLRLIVDLEMTDNADLRTIAMHHLREKYGQEETFSEKMRLIGLRGDKENFKGAISHYELLNHMEKGNFVFHTAGWGVGEIMDVSMLREQVSCEFDYASGLKDLPFQIAFQTLIPIPHTHFLACRFGDPDALEAKAKQTPVEVIRMLLKDLGPKTSAEIKDELCELVIPEGEWNKWWQTARTKIRKDTHIESPKNARSAFRLLKEEISHEKRLQQALTEQLDADALISVVYTFLKDFSDTLKDSEFKASLLEKLKELVSLKEVTDAEQIQLYFLLQDLSTQKHYPPVEEFVKKSTSIKELTLEIPIQAFKKRLLVGVRNFRSDWQLLFLDLLFIVEQNSLRDFIFAELLTSASKKDLEEKLKNLAGCPQQHPELLIWYFQKIVGSKSTSESNTEECSQLFESLLILLSYLEQHLERRELIKKIHGMLTAGRFALVRKVMKHSTADQVREFLLLVTKCSSLADHDIQIFHSLAEVAHPELKDSGNAAKADDNVIWTTKEGQAILQGKIEQIGTVETVENAKEIEEARSHGDLRENAEFKAALERRDRLQEELKRLSDQLGKCCVLTENDIDTSQVSVGTRVTLGKNGGETTSYTLLGPWDADPDKQILSFQSKLAKSMIGKKVGDTLELLGETYTIRSIEAAI